VRACTPASPQMRTMSRIAAPGAVGMARFDFAHYRDDHLTDLVTGGHRQDGGAVAQHRHAVDLHVVLPWK